MTSLSAPSILLPPQFKSLNWFPGHMLKGLKDIQSRLPKTQAILEVRDARIPLSSSNPKLIELIRQTKKKHIILLNKVDLADPNKTKLFVEKLERETSAVVIPCSLHSPKSLHTLIRFLKNSISSDSSVLPWASSRLLICGLPNVGKSTLINSLRMVGTSQKKAAKTGSLPGVTRRLSYHIKISEDPTWYIWDTPGIMAPSLKNRFQAWRIALIGSFKDHLVDEEKLAECLWYHRSLFTTPPLPTDEPNFYEFLSKLAFRILALEKGGVPDTRRASMHFIKSFRLGEYGRITLDELDDTLSP